MSNVNRAGEILLDWNSGLSRVEICEKYGFKSVNGLGRFACDMRKRGYPFKMLKNRPTMTEAEINKCVIFRQYGMTYTLIGKCVHMTAVTV